MSFQTWWLFVLMTFVVSGTPGPNMLLVMHNGARSGWRATMATMAGCMTSLIAMMSLSAAGLGALLQAFPAMFEGLRLVGAAYLMYLGVMCWRAPVNEASPVTPQEVEPHVRRIDLYRRGLLVAASNPKAILFCAAFFPQFINPQVAKLPQFGLLIATFTVIEVGWYFVYALSGHRLARYLQRASVLRTFNRVTGGVFIGFAALMSGLWELRA